MAGLAMLGQMASQNPPNPQPGGQTPVIPGPAGAPVTADSNDPAAKAKAVRDVLSNLAAGRPAVGNPPNDPTAGKPPQPGSTVANHVDQVNNPFAPGGQYYGVDPNLVAQTHNQQQAVDTATSQYGQDSDLSSVGAPPQYQTPTEDHVGRKNTLAAILGGLALLAGPGYKGSGIGSLFANFDNGLQQGREKAMTRADAQAKEKFDAASKGYENKVDLAKFKSSAAFQKFNIANQQLEDTRAQVDNQHKLAVEEHDKLVDRIQQAQEFVKTFGLQKQEFDHQVYAFTHLSAGEQAQNRISMADLGVRRREVEANIQNALATLALHREEMHQAQRQADRSYQLEASRFKAEQDPNNALSPAFKIQQTLKDAQIKKIPDELKNITKTYAKTADGIGRDISSVPKFYDGTTGKLTPAGHAEYVKRMNQALEVAELSRQKAIQRAVTLGADMSMVTDWKQDDEVKDAAIANDKIFGYDSGITENTVPSKTANPAVVQSGPPKPPSQPAGPGIGSQSLGSLLTGGPSQSAEDIQRHEQMGSREPNMPQPSAQPNHPANQPITTPASAKNNTFSNTTTDGRTFYSNDNLHWYDENGNYMGMKKAQ